MSAAMFVLSTFGGFFLCFAAMVLFVGVVTPLLPSDPGKDV